MVNQRIIPREKRNWTSDLVMSTFITCMIGCSCLSWKKVGGTANCRDLWCHSLSPLPAIMLCQRLRWLVIYYFCVQLWLTVCYGSDGGIEELTEDLSGGKILYAYVKVIDPNTNLPKFVFINWVIWYCRFDFLFCDICFSCLDCVVWFQSWKNCLFFLKFFWFFETSKN